MAGLFKIVLKGLNGEFAVRCVRRRVGILVVKMGFS